MLNSQQLHLLLGFQPERINPETGNQAYDTRSDVWSLGISLVSRITAVLFIDDIAAYFLKILRSEKEKYWLLVHHIIKVVH